MLDAQFIDFSVLTFEKSPFPHFYSRSFFQNGFESQLFDWFEKTEEWSLTETEFYEQYEFSFLNIKLPENLLSLISENTISVIEEEFKKLFDIKFLNLVGVTAHKLINGQKIGIHNDFIKDEETHRLVININPLWTDSNGGYLILFNSSKVEDVTKVIKPINNSAFGFEISSRSHHAISKIYDFSRYSIVYTFKAE
jgi:Rps23 Pro-64 3,4-dihydroxylase Tpa1-like proline 4-hydroxylase